MDKLDIFIEYLESELEILSAANECSYLNEQGQTALRVLYGVIDEAQRIKHGE